MEINLTWCAEKSLGEQQSCWNAGFTTPTGAWTVEKAVNFHIRGYGVLFPTGSRHSCCQQSRSWYQLHQMKACPYLQGEEKQSDLPVWVSAYVGWKLQSTCYSKWNMHISMQWPVFLLETAFTQQLRVALDTASASNFFHSVVPIYIDLTANPQQ